MKPLEIAKQWREAWNMLQLVEGDIKFTSWHDFLSNTPVGQDLNALADAYLDLHAAIVRMRDENINLKQQLEVANGALVSISEHINKLHVYHEDFIKPGPVITDEEFVGFNIEMFDGKKWSPVAKKLNDALKDIELAEGEANKRSEGE